MIITYELIENFKQYLHESEKSAGTIEHYTYAVETVLKTMAGGELTREKLIAWKESATKKYAIPSVNAMIAGINVFLRFCKLEDLQLQSLRFQRKAFLNEKLSEADVKKLIENAKRQNDRTTMAVVAILSETGIRVSEVQYITVEAVEKGVAVITMKGKTRETLLSDNLQKMLRNYIKIMGVTSGAVILDRQGRPMDRRRIWERLKKLCEGTDVDPKRVHPHAFRHLFARAFYTICRDLAKLADILGHSSVNTTRIYLIDTIDVHRELLNKLSEKLHLSRRYLQNIETVRTKC